MISFKKFLMETPPPDDWDREVFTKSYKKQIDYALERAKKLGAGSSRVVFEIEYEGRMTVLKIAKNAKGLAQNEKEADWGLYRMYPDITTPLIDIDEANEMPRWIHLEKAEKMSKSQFKNITGFSFDDFTNLLTESEDGRMGRNGHRRHWNGDIPQEVKEEIYESEIYQDITDLMANFDIMSGDLGRTANWGLYKNSPVIIDLGFDSNIQKTFYDRTRR
jgi:hypothetical protein